MLDEFLVQKHISKPALILNRKYDIRMFVLLMGTDPLRIYLYNNGYVRIALEEFETPN